MEKHPIESWDQWVHSELHPAVLIQSAQETLNGYLATTKELKEALKTQLLRDTLYNKTEKEVQLLVERYQIKLTSLMDRLFHFQHDDSITVKLKEFYGAVAAQLEMVIVLLQNDYGRYFNSDLNLPLSLRLREAHVLKRQWKLLFKTMRDLEANARLLNVLDKSIKEILDLHERPAISYQQVSYFKNLLKEISGYILSSTCPPVYASLTELLISCNFNDLAFIRQVCSDFRTELEKKKSDECKLEFLKNSEKQLRQLLEQQKNAFDTNLPVAKQIILNWIGQEQAYLQAILALPKKEALEGVKMHTSLPVSILAAIARLMKDSGIITNTNQTDIFNFFTSNFVTQQKKGFSYEHLRTRYYQVEERTKEKAYDYLMEMAQLCKKL